MKVERVDDLPVLYAQIESLGLRDLFATHFIDHSNWGGISGAQMVCGWLTYICSQADHRLSYVQDWAHARLGVLSNLLDEDQVRDIDFCDDRLGRYLDRLSDDENWSNFEQALGSSIVEVYAIKQSEQPPIIRTDSFNAPQFREPGDLCLYGYNKQRRRDQPFYKVVTSALDPSAVPLAVSVVQGSGPDTPHYRPIIERVQSMFTQSGQLYVGDSHLGSMGNRCYITKSKDFYLMPLNLKQFSKQKRDELFEQADLQNYRQLKSIYTDPNCKRASAYFYEHKRSLVVEDQSWNERVIAVYSPQYAQGLVTSFVNRIIEAQEHILDLVVRKNGRKYPTSLNTLYGRIAKIESKYGVQGCLKVNCYEQVEDVHIRAHKQRPSRVESRSTFIIEVKQNAELIERKKRRLGWQIYATNIPEKQMSGAEVVRTYRDEYRIEHLFDYTINRDVGLLPLFLKKEHRVKGLIRLLMIAMRINILIEQRVRKGLKEKKEQLTNLFPGNKGRKTSTPTVAMILRAFRQISLVIFDETTTKLSTLTPIQLKLLDLMGLNEAYSTMQIKFYNSV